MGPVRSCPRRIRQHLGFVLGSIWPFSGWVRPPLGCARPSCKPSGGERWLVIRGSADISGRGRVSECCSVANQGAVRDQLLRHTLATGAPRSTNGSRLRGRVSVAYARGGRFQCAVWRLTKSAAPALARTKSSLHSWDAQAMCGGVVGEEPCGRGRLSPAATAEPALGGGGHWAPKRALATPAAVAATVRCGALVSRAASTAASAPAAGPPFRSARACTSPRALRGGATLKLGA